jgi:CubicO group peptidase (beta-lactamase class C family)
VAGPWNDGGKVTDLRLNRRALMGALAAGGLGWSSTSVAGTASPPRTRIIRRDTNYFAVDYSKPESLGNTQNLASVVEMRPSSRPRPFADGAPIRIPDRFEFDGQLVEMAEFLGKTGTSALLVLTDGKVRYEEYRSPGGREVHWNAMSAGKSLTSAMVGIALRQGKIASLDDRADKYLPWIAGADYGAVTIRQLLQMSSGMARGDREVPNIGAAAAAGTLRDYLRAQKRVTTPGSVNEYVNANPILLGYILAAATGKTIAEYMQDELWEPIGLERPAYLAIDKTGMEIMGGGVMLIARDYARLGELYRHNGAWSGRQIISPQFVRESTAVMAPHLSPEQVDLKMGYGYLWWIPEPGKDFSALGHFGQYVYVNPARRTTIVKLSADLKPGYPDGSHRVTMAALKAIAATTAWSTWLSAESRWRTRHDSNV